MSDQEENAVATQDSVAPNKDSKSEKDNGTKMDSDVSTEQLSTQEIEKMEEAKLKAKFPNSLRPMSGHSAFLQKRLAKGKYFDSGDYQMAKQKNPTAKARIQPVLTYATGDAIPTPESVPVRKTSIIQQSKLASSSTT